MEHLTINLDRVKGIQNIKEEIKKIEETTGEMTEEMTGEMTEEMTEEMIEGMIEEMIEGMIEEMIEEMTEGTLNVTDKVNIK